MINCAENFLKIQEPRPNQISNRQIVEQIKMAKPIIDITNIHEPKKGAYIINADVENKPLKTSPLIAAFDLDHTLIKTKSGNKFPKDYQDWIIIPGVKEKLNEFYEKDYKIVVFTNQAGSSFDIKEFAKKVRSIAVFIGISLQAFVATDYGYVRKPCVGMWWLLTRNNDGIDIDMQRSFYVDDAYSKVHSFSDSGLKFALNLGLKFYKDIKMTNEIFPKPVHPLELTPYFDKFLNDTEVFPAEKQEMIILVGPPASGKSSFSKNFPDYVVVSQDELGTKQKVINATKKALKEGSSIIIDRKNEYKEDRALFIELASEYNAPVRIIWFDMSRDLSDHLCTYREITTGKHIPSIVFNKYYSKEKGLEQPDEDEGAQVIKLYFKIDLGMIKNPTLFFNYLV